MWNLKEKEELGVTVSFGSGDWLDKCVAFLNGVPLERTPLGLGTFELCFGSALRSFDKERARHVCLKFRAEVRARDTHFTSHWYLETDR